jgi:hypothetical protein
VIISRKEFVQVPIVNNGRIVEMIDTRGRMLFYNRVGSFMAN